MHGNLQLNYVHTAQVLARSQFEVIEVYKNICRVLPMAPTKIPSCQVLFPSSLHWHSQTHHEALALDDERRLRSASDYRCAIVTFFGVVYATATDNVYMTQIAVPTQGAITTYQHLSASIVWSLKSQNKTSQRNWMQSRQTHLHAWTTVLYIL